jgi:transposase-like protein
MSGKRKRYSADFKAKVALDALRGELTTAQLVAKHEVHQTLICDWKRQAVSAHPPPVLGRPGHVVRGARGWD